MYRPDLTQQHSIPGSSQMMSSYDRMLKSKGFDQEKEEQEEASKAFDKWATNQSQMGGPVNATEFKKYQTALAAWNLHQGPGGKSYAEKVSKAFGGRGAIEAPKTSFDIDLRSSMNGEKLR
jgi:hypothetical protein